MSSNYTQVPINTLVGEALTKILPTKDKIEFVTESNREFVMFHNQDCCESVLVDDISGDINRLIGSPILLAEERSYREENKNGDSTTWTFYTLRTVAGTVDIRWCGTSNGYYSETVDFVEWDVSDILNNKTVIVAPIKDAKKLRDIFLQYGYQYSRERGPFGIGNLRWVALAIYGEDYYDLYELTETSKKRLKGVGGEEVVEITDVNTDTVELTLFFHRLGG